MTGRAFTGPIRPERRQNSRPNSGLWAGWAFPAPFTVCRTTNVGGFKARRCRRLTRDAFLLLDEYLGNMASGTARVWTTRIRQGTPPSQFYFAWAGPTEPPPRPLLAARVGDLHEPGTCWYAKD